MALVRVDVCWYKRSSCHWTSLKPHLTVINRFSMYGYFCLLISIFLKSVLSFINFQEGSRKQKRTFKWGREFEPANFMSNKPGFLSFWLLLLLKWWPFYNSSCKHDCCTDKHQRLAKLELRRQTASGPASRSSSGQTLNWWLTIDETSDSCELRNSL